jgi:hypothetical protein
MEHGYDSSGERSQNSPVYTPPSADSAGLHLHLRPILFYQF